MAGGGIKPGITYGATDDLGYHIAEDTVHVHDLQATILHCSASTRAIQLSLSGPEPAPDRPHERAAGAYAIVCVREFSSAKGKPLRVARATSP